MRSQMHRGLRFSARQCAVNTRVLQDESGCGGQWRCQCSEWSLITSLFILIDLVTFTRHSGSASIQSVFTVEHWTLLPSKCTVVACLFVSLAGKLAFNSVPPSGTSVDVSPPDYTYILSKHASFHIFLINLIHNNGALKTEDRTI